MNLAIFDIDGTLTNTNSVDDECFVKALSEAHGINDISTEWSTYPHTTDSGITLKIFHDKFGRDPQLHELDKFKACFIRMLSQQSDSNSSSFSAINNAAEALERLKREPDWAVAIATGSWRESALLKLRAAKIDIAGTPAAFAEDGLSREEILQSAVTQSLQQCRVRRFEKTVSVGDGLWDVRTAHRLGFTFLGVGTGERASTLKRAGAKHVIEDYVDYDQFLHVLSQAEIPGEECLG